MVQVVKPTMEKEPKEEQQNKVERSRQVKVNGGKDNVTLEHDFLQNQGGIE